MKVLGYPDRIYRFRTNAQIKLEAKDVVPNTNRMQAAERAEKYRFLTMVTLTFKVVRARDQTHLPCEFGTNPFSGSEIFHIQTKRSQTAPKTEPYAVHCGR